MADYINKVILKGRPGKAPELRYMPSGDPVCNFNIATKSSNTHVEWHRIVAYKHLAERAMRDFDTGDLVYIEGEIKTREMISADDKANNRKARKITEIIATAVHLVEKKGAAGSKEDSDLPPQDEIAAADNSNDSTPAPAASSGIPSYL